MGQHKQLLRLHTPATYCLRLQGILDESWSEHLSDMTICVSQAEGEAPVTKLTGRLLDQAVLLGVLNSVYNLGLPLLSVECLDAE
jgi:hypothetical protein